MSVFHGGRLDEARRLFPQAPQPWIDLSTGVSPRAWPLPHFPPEVFTRLPDESAFAAAEDAAAAAYGVPSSRRVVAGAGAQAFIRELPRVFPTARVGVLGFTYAEHAAQWRASGAEVVTVEALDELAAFDAAIIVNPNNPDGRVVAPDALASLADRLAARGGLLVVDESFADMTPQISLAPRAPDNAIVLRSFGKAYGLPGLRLGFAIAAPERAERLRAALGPWPVAGPALATGAAALADRGWLEDAVVASRRSARRLDELLASAGFAIVGGADLFRLAARSDATEGFERLARAGIFTRRFPERADWLRFGLPGDETQWARLALALGRDA